MATINVSLPSDGDTIDSADYNTPITTIVNEVNGGLDNDNIASGAAIAGSKIADNSIDVGAKTSVWDGWVEVSDSWTYASATTVTVPTDATTKYSVGDRVQFNQSGVKYFQVTAVAATVLTLQGIGGATVANAAISDVKYSKVGSPVGFSQAWQSWTPTFTNFTVGSSTLACYYIQIGKTVICRFDLAQGAGSSMGTYPYFTLPVTGKSVNFDTVVGEARLVANSNGYKGTFHMISTTTVGVICWGAGGSYLSEANVTSTAPNTWGTTGAIRGWFMYEAA